MACFTSARRASGPFLGHAVVELAFVRVLVTSGARAILEVIRNNFRGVSGQIFRVALRAGDRQVRARQCEPRLVMLRNRVSGRLEARDDVALFTAVLIGSLRKLPAVHIAVAIRAICKRHFILRGRAGREVTFRARHVGVLPLQRVSGCRMLLHAELRRLPSIHRVALRALAFALPCRKLTGVRILRVAIHAFRKDNFLLEIPSDVAFQAIHFGVLTEQRIFRLGVIELLARRDFFPTARRMARFAGLREGSAVRIGVAIHALAERDSREPRGASRRRRRVAFRAGNLRVKPGQRKPSLVVINFVRRFPVREIVALQAILPELSLVGILVAGNAILREPQKRLIEILHLDQRLHGWRNPRRHVAPRALDPRVFSFELVSRLVVIESFQRWDPVDQRKILAVVLRVAFRAVLFVRKTGVQPSPLRELLADFRVALLAAQHRGAFAHHVATGALRGSAERFVRFGKRARRNLRASHTTAEEGIRGQKRDRRRRPNEKPRQGPGIEDELEPASRAVR